MLARTSIYLPQVSYIKHFALKICWLRSSLTLLLELEGISRKKTKALEVVRIYL